MSEKIFIRCPSCSTRLGMAASREGSQVRCPKCKTPIKVPTREPAQAAPSAVEAAKASAGSETESFGGDSDTSKEHDAYSLASGSTAEEPNERDRSDFDEDDVPDFEEELPDFGAGELEFEDELIEPLLPPVPAARAAVPDVATSEPAPKLQNATSNIFDSYKKHRREDPLQTKLLYLSIIALILFCLTTFVGMYVTFNAAMTWLNFEPDTDNSIMSVSMQYGALRLQLGYALALLFVAPLPWAWLHCWSELSMRKMDN